MKIHAFLRVLKGGAGGGAKIKLDSKHNANPTINGIATAKPRSNAYTKDTK